jgi:hypothetical protein
MNSVIGSSKSLIWFDRRRTQRKFTRKIEKYDTQRLLMAALRSSDLANALIKAQRVSAKNYNFPFQDSHNAVNSE